VTYQVYLSAHAQRDLDGFPDKITKQILGDCARLAEDPIAFLANPARLATFGSAMRSRSRDRLDQEKTPDTFSFHPGGHGSWKLWEKSRMSPFVLPFVSIRTSCTAAQYRRFNLSISE
jgi:hypothetical protein